MDNQADVLILKGNTSLLGGIILGVFNWMTPETVDMGLKIVTGIGGAVAVFFAARYHWYATKVKKEQLRKLKESNDTEGE